MFCTHCGNKNEESAGFCSACGAAIKPKGSSTAQVQADKSSFISKIPKPALLGIAGLLVLALAASVFVLFSKAPTEENAIEYVLQESDVTDLNLKTSDDINDWTADDKLFNADCTDGALFNKKASRGSSWAKSEYERPNDNFNYISLSNQIIGFNDESDAKALVSAAQDAESSCRNDIVEKHEVYSIEKGFGVDLEGTYWEDTIEGGSIWGCVIIRRGNAVSVFTFFAGSDDGDLYSSNISGPQLASVVKTAVERFSK